MVRTARPLAAIAALLLCAILSDSCQPVATVPYRDEMRQFVQAISAYAKSRTPGFIVIPQNGPEIMTTNGESDGPPATAYLGALDGVGREDLFYGFDNDDQPTPAQELDYMLGFTDLALARAKTVLVIDYCSTHANVDDSYTQNETRGHISFAADDRELASIPAYPAAPHNASSQDVDSLTDAANFLYIINTESYPARQEFLAAVDATNYDILIIDLFHGDGAPFTPDEVARLKTKPGGATRLVIAYMSIGEAEDYRYYWQATWSANPPSWLAAENPDWPGNYKVEYWDPAWQSIILGDDSAYLDRIINAGFDGVYLDIIDAFEYFESL